MTNAQHYPFNLIIRDKDKISVYLSYYLFMINNVIMIKNAILDQSNS